MIINQHIYVHLYPLPRFKNIKAKLSGYKMFSVIDLTEAYLQMEGDPSSRTFTVVAIHKVYFQYKRLPLCTSYPPKNNGKIFCSHGQSASLY